MTTPHSGGDPLADDDPAALRERCDQLQADLEDTRTRLRGFVLENEELHTRLREFQNSASLVVGARLARMIEQVLPYGTTRRRTVARCVRGGYRTWNRMLGRIPRAGSPDERPRREAITRRAYRNWLSARTPTPAALERQRRNSAAWARRPLISVCMPVYEPDPEHLRRAIHSVLAQSYDNWELCICNDASERPGVAQVLAEEQEREQRIQVVTSEKNGGISDATNRALAVARGEYVAFLDDDDLIVPNALYAMVERLQRDPDIDLFYCDEDVLLLSGERADPFLKPDWSPETELSMNFVTHFLVVRRSLVDRLGGLRSEHDGAQDHDLVLRVAEVTDNICHVPEVLYTWRQSERSTALHEGAKSWALAAGHDVVADALERRGIAATVEPGPLSGGWRVRYVVDPLPDVAIVIATRDRLDLLRTCVDSVRTLTDYPSYSIVVLDNGSTHPATLRYLREAPLRSVPAPGPFNYSALMNRGFSETTAEFVLTLNNDTVVLHPDWLRGLVEIASQPDVGVVGCKLMFPDGRVQHEGIVVGRGVPAANLAFDVPGIRMANLLACTRDVSAVTGACSLIRRSAWEAVGGFDESLGVVYNDVDLCLRIRQAGFRIVYTPHVTLIHDESSSRGLLHPIEEQRAFLERWGADAGGDPYFPPALRLGMGGWQLAG
jgi:GT2 family glycosyltransferase